MRIVAGTLGGRRIRAPRGRGTRPTPERVREAVFSAIGSVDGLTVLDLFAGSGALGLEAVSRGARRATLVDRDRAAHTTIASNVTALGLDEQCTVLRADWRRALTDLARAEIAYDIVFLDPPYGDWEVIRDDLGEALEPVLASGARVVAEHPATEAPSLPHMQVERRRAYGDTAVTFMSLRTGSSG